MTDELPYEVPEKPKGKKYSVFTLDEMRILRAAISLHLQDEKAIPLLKVSKDFGITHTAIVRCRDRMKNGEVPFRQRPNPEAREPFSDRAKSPRHQEVLRKHVDRYMTGSAIPDADAIPEEKDIEEIVLDGADVSDKRRRLLAIAQNFDLPESIRIQAELAEHKISTAHGETEKGPGAPLTIAESIQRLSMLNKAVGWETAKKAMLEAYGDRCKKADWGVVAKAAS